MSILASSSRSAHASSLRTVTAGLWTHAVRQWRAHRADLALYGMSDEMLHDIGISRGEIEDATRHGRPARP